MVFDKIKDIIVEQLDVEEDAVTMEASITEDLGADSLDVVDLVMSIEESFDVEIPDSVKSLSMVPSNFKFSANSSFVNDGKMIYQNTQKGKVLVYYDQIESGVMNVPEGVNGIQVGAFINMQELKTLVLPSTFSFINYNVCLFFSNRDCVFFVK